MLNEVTPLILCYNEAPNIGRVLDQLRWAHDIVVLDSFSEDETVQIALGFSCVRVHQRKLDSHEQQWNYGLRETGITTPWVLALDADYILTEELKTELELLQPPSDIHGYNAKFTYCINGKRLRSGIYPPVTVLYRREHAFYYQDGHTQKLELQGEVSNLRAPILHDDRKPLRRWFQSQAGYAELEARKLLTSEPAVLTWKDRVRRWRVVAPPAMFFYCLVLRGGVLDGWAGFYYAFQRALAELMLSLYLLDQFIGSRRHSEVPNAVPHLNGPDSSSKLKAQSTKL